MPSLQTNPKNLRIRHLRNPHKIKQPLHQILLTLWRFQNLQMSLEEPTQKQRQPLNKDTILLRPILKRWRQVRLRGKHHPQPLQESTEKLPKERIILRIQILQIPNLCKTVKGIISKHGLGKEFVQERIYQVRLKDKSERDPGEKPLQGLKCHLQQRWTLTMC